MNKQRILLMFANEYDMRTEDGRNMKGCILNYYFSGENCESLKLCTGTTGSIGYQRAKCSVDYDMRDKITAAPAYYDAEFSMKVGSDGKPVLVVENLEFVADAAFSMVGHKKNNA